MGIVCPGKIALMALRALKARPDIRLDVFQHVAQVHCAIGVRQSAGYQDLSLLFTHIVMLYLFDEGSATGSGAESGIMS